MKKHRLPAAVLALAALGFTLGTCEFVIVGILPDIAAGLNVSLAAVGRLVSVFAACYAVGTPLLTALTGRMDRFRLLMGLMLLFLGVNVLSMLAPGVAVLYASRVVAALVSGTLTAVAMLYAKEVSSPEQTARAISAVYAGFSVAAVAGVPIGTAVCHALGWRATFGVILAMGLVLLPVLARLLPREIDVPPAEGGLLNQFAVLRDSRCWHCVLMVLFSASATYTVYTYLTPTLTGTLGLPETAVSPVLLGMGALQCRQQFVFRMPCGKRRSEAPAGVLCRAGSAVCRAASATGEPVAGIDRAVCHGPADVSAEYAGAGPFSGIGRGGIPGGSQPLRVGAAGVL